MPFEHKENSGNLFRNERKEKDTHADYRGEANVDGTLYWLDAWLNESKGGKKYLSVKFKPKDEDQPRRSEQTGGNETQDESELPF